MPTIMPTELLAIEIFDWTSPNGKCQISFATTSMLIAMRTGKLPYEEILSPMDPEFVRDWLSERIDNMDYVRKLSAQRLAEPLVGVWMPAGMVLLIDGAHRYMANWLQDPLRLLSWRLVSLFDWTKYATIRGRL